MDALGFTFGHARMHGLHNLDLSNAGNFDRLFDELELFGRFDLPQTGQQGTQAFRVYDRFRGLGIHVDLLALGSRDAVDPRLELFYKTV